MSTRCLRFGVVSRLGRVACVQTTLLILFADERDGEVSRTNGHRGSSDAVADSGVDRRCVGVYTARYRTESSPRKFATCIDATDTEKSNTHYI